MRKNPLLRLSIFTIFLSTLFLLPLSVYAKGGNLLIVIDASGSMWGRIDGIIKMELAKTSLGVALQNIHGGPNIGLIAFGHNRQKDCQDIEFLSPLRKIEKPFLIDKVNALNPKGKTPLASTISMAVEEVQQKGEEATILIISDGKDTCGEDPCAIAKQLKQQSAVDFKIDVIGLITKGDNKSQTEESYEQLKCITDVTGGTFYSVDNAGDFTFAVAKAIANEVELDEKKVEEEMEDYRFSTDLQMGDYELSELINEGNSEDEIINGVSVLSAGFIDFGEYKVGEIVHAHSERDNIYLHDKVTLKLDAGAKKGDQFLSYKVVEEDVEDSAGDEFGNHYEISSVLEVTEKYKGNYYFAKVKKLFNTTLVGDPLMVFDSFYENPKKYPYLQKPQRSFNGASIIATFRGHVFAGEGNFVFINKGKADKVFIGDDFEVILTGKSPVVIEAGKDLFEQAYSAFAKEETIPEQKGVLTIIGLREHTALGLITKSEKKIITVGDTLKLIND